MAKKKKRKAGLPKLIIKNPFPLEPALPEKIRWSVSKCKVFKKCKRKFFWKYIMHLRHRAKAAPLLFGTYFHEALAEWYRSKRSSMTKIALRYSEEAEKEISSICEFYDQKEYDKLTTLIETFQGITYHRQGEFKQSITSLESGLGRLGLRMPRSIPGLVIGILREVAVQVGHTVFPQRLHRRQANPKADLVIRLLNWLSQQTIFENTIKAVYTQLASLNRAERFPLSAGLAHSTAWHGMLMSMLGPSLIPVLVPM